MIHWAAVNIILLKGWDPEHVQNVYLITDISEDTVVTTPLLQGLELKIANKC